MTQHTCPPLASFLWATALLLLLMAAPASAQFTVHPSLGLQTIWFNGDVPASQPISPGLSRDLPLGGGMMSTNNGV
jgi:hypothetical protein